MSFVSVDELHDVAGDWSGERVLVEHAPLEAFSQLVGQFCAALGESAEEAYWEPVVRWLKRARWDAATTPLPLLSEVLGLAEATREAVPRLRRCDQVAPELAVAAEDLADRLTTLSESTEDPFGDAVGEALSAYASEGGSGESMSGGNGEGDETNLAAEVLAEMLYRDSEALALRDPVATRQLAVVLKSARYYDEVKRAVSRVDPSISVLTASEFLASSPLDLAVVVGASAWFPPAVVQAPRARRMVFIYPAWVRDAEPQELLLAGSSPRQTGRISNARPRSSRPFGEGLPVAAADEWTPNPDWRAISAAGQRNGAEPGNETVDAWLFALASGDGVYLEASEGTRAYIAEVEEDEVSIHQELTSRIGPGDFIVLRTEGEGDYIRSIADAILSDRAEPLREMQARWKDQLAAKQTEMGTDALRRALRAEGAGRASSNNIRQWLRPDSIRTRDPADFSAIAAVIGAREQFRELWDGMREIDSAHRRAGFQVRDLLVDEMRHGDRSALVAQGWADFDVEEIEGEGALRVARIDGKAPEAQDVPRSHTRRPFTIERDLWLV